MKIQLQHNRQNYPLNNRKNENSKGTTSFKGFSAAMNFFATNQGVGACCTDLGFMVFPRIRKDASRGCDAAVETGIREGSGTTNHALIGVYGMGAGALLGTALAKNYDVEAKNIFTAPARIDELAKHWSEHLRNNTSERDFLTKIVNEISGYNTAKNLETGFVGIQDEYTKKIIDLFEKGVAEIEPDKWKKSNERGILKALIIEATGAESKLKIGNSSTSNVETLVDDIVNMTRTFKKEKVLEAFNEAIQGGENKFLKSLSKFNKGRALAGFVIASGIGMAVQPFNVWLTKKRTGRDDFVGSSDGGGKDTSLKFKLEKLATGAAMIGMALCALNCKPKDFLNKMAFQGHFPTLDQLKGVYGLTIAGRVAAARSEDELWESARKDIIGYLSWLVLGDFVNRGSAAFIDSSLINYNKVHDKNKITGGVLKSRSEVLREALASVGISTIKKDANGVEKAMNLSEMIKTLKENPRAASILKPTNKKLLALNFAQVMGYAFTGIVLGYGIPTMNIYMTHRAERKRREKALELNQINQVQLAKANENKEQQVKVVA